MLNEEAVDLTFVMSQFQGTAPVPGDGNDDKDNADAGESMMLTASRSGSEVTFRATADGDTADDTPAMVLINNIKGTVNADDGIGSALVDVDLPGGITKRIYLMTDITDPGSRLFSDFAAGANSGLEGAEVDASIGGQEHRYPVTALGGGTLLADTADDDVNVAELDDVHFYPGVLQPTTQQPTQVVVQNATFTGTYAGVEGVYICTPEAGCEFGLDDGDLTLTVGIFAFRPNADEAGAPDTDYLIYGAWLKQPDSPVGSGASAGVATGNAPFLQANIADLEGTVTYTGEAAGFYAERHVDSSAADSGTFRAMAELKANFDEAGAGGAGTSVSGTISEFRRGGEATVMVDWLVNLDPVDVGAVPGGHAAGKTGGTASGASWTGEWGFQLLGNVVTAPVALPAIPPTGISGTFGAQHGTPRLVATDESPDEGFVGVIGGFGTRR